jgi:hypothetical protein
MAQNPAAPPLPREKKNRPAMQLSTASPPGAGNILMDCEDPDEFQQVFHKLVGIHAPATPAEDDTVEEMFAARWRIRRMWTIETNLLNVEILTQRSASLDPGIHLAMAYRALADDSRSLALASRYEARLQRTYDRAYKTLRELQQIRKSQPPAQPHTVKVMWVDSQEELDMRAAAAAAETPTEPRASASGPANSSELPNEPTDAATKEVNNDAPVQQDLGSQISATETPAPPPHPPVAANSNPKSTEDANVESVP